MKFLVIDIVNEKEELALVESESPLEAMKSQHHNLISKYLKNPNSFDREDRATIGVYEVGEYNQLQSINQNGNLASWSNSRISELEMTSKNIIKMVSEKIDDEPSDHFNCLRDILQILLPKEDYEELTYGQINAKYSNE